jgi:hypothetical protein
VPFQYIVISNVVQLFDLKKQATILSFNKIDNQRTSHFDYFKKLTIRESLVLVTLKVSNNLQFS